LSNSEDVPQSDFTDEDRQKADWALELYLQEITGVGLRSEFDAWPGHERNNQHRDAWLFGDLPGFKGRAKRFGDFVTLLERFKDRPVTEAHPFAVMEGFPSTVTFTIDEATLVELRLFCAALLGYAEALLQYGVGSAEAAEAARAVAYVIKPVEWRNAGAPVPDGANQNLGRSTRWYLEAVLRTAPQQG
jgi:hypothetical protein